MQQFRRPECTLCIKPNFTLHINIYVDPIKQQALYGDLYTVLQVMNMSHVARLITQWDLQSMKKTPAQWQTEKQRESEVYR